VAGSLAFTLWHIAVTINTVQRTSLPQRWYWLLPSLLGGLAAVFVGGRVFGLLRYYTGNLVSVFAAHWTVDALMMLALYRRARTTFPIAAS
jgi:membrane protease YdiL (CAAX protease family)